MNSFILKKIPSKGNLQLIKKLIGTRLVSIQAIKLQVLSNSCLIEGLTKIGFLQKQETSHKYFFLDLFSDFHQSPIDEELYSFNMNIGLFEGKKKYTQSGNIINLPPPVLLNTEILNYLGNSTISKIELHGKNKRGKINSEPFFLKKFNFDEYDIELINQIVFYHSGGAVTIISADSSNRISLSQFIQNKKKIEKIKHRLNAPLFEFF